MIGYRKISRTAFYRAGGFSNARLVRTMRGKSWTYWERAS